jgi:hypothetical protein
MDFPSRNKSSSDYIRVPTIMEAGGLAASYAAAIQSRTVPSVLPDASRFPSGEKATLQTLPLWPSSVCRTAPVAASQSRTVPSVPPPDASRFPSSEKATLQTLPSWPSSVCRAAIKNSEIHDINAYFFKLMQLGRRYILFASALSDTRGTEYLEW